MRTEVGPGVGDGGMSSTSGYNNLADDPDLNPYGSEAFLQSIADATELRSHAEDRIATQLAMDESTQDSSSLIVAFASLTKLKRKQIQRKMTTKTKTNSGD